MPVAYGSALLPDAKGLAYSRSSGSINLRRSHQTPCSSPYAGRELLLSFTKLDFKGQAHTLVDTSASRTKLREALVEAVGQPWSEAGYDPAAQPSQVLLSVLASSVQLAMRSWRDYSDALALPRLMPTSRVAGCATLSAISGSVYVKVNVGAGKAYATSYAGRDRGVLVQLAGKQLGHLPLGLFDESMSAPLPNFD